MRIFNALRVMEKLRAEHAIFSGQAGVETMETGSRSVLGILRYLGMDQHLRAYFNFSEQTQHFWTMPDDEAERYVDLFSGKTMKELGDQLEPYGYRWYLEQPKAGEE